jgi:pilus assembly protein CpaB
LTFLIEVFMQTFFQTLRDETGPSRTRRSPAFRAVSASRTYAAKVRWLVGGLLSVIVVLTTAMILLFRQINTPEQPQAVAAAVAPQTGNIALTRILVARQRIEAGARITPAVFDVQELKSEYVPAEAIRESERDDIIGRYAKQLINTGFPLSRDVLSPTPPSGDEDFIIPDGFRAIAISIDEVSSVSYNIKPGNRVDVILAYLVNGQPAVVTVVETAKVLSIGGNTTPNGSNRGAQSATLLVSAESARKIELAKKLGTLSLVLAGKTEAPAVITDPNPTLPSEVIGGRKLDPKPLPEPNGRAIARDPNSGKEVRYSLSQGRWKRE